MAGVAQGGVVRVANGPVLADGSTQAEVRLWTDTPAEKIKIVPLSGTLGPVAVSPDGIVVARWTPAAVADQGEVPWTVTVGKDVATIGIPVVPAVAAKMAITVDPVVVRAGEVASVKITGAPGDLPVLVRASSGTLGAPVRETDGWRVSWTAPKATAPLVGVFTVADARYPELAYVTGVARVPAKQTVKVEVPAGSKSTLTAGDKKLGPVTATGTSASFDVEVDPSARTGTLDITRADGTTESRGVILANGSAALEWIPGPASYAGQSVAVLRLAAVGADGGMLTATAPRVTATAGTVRDLRVEGQLWRVELALPPSTGPLAVTAEFAGVKSEIKLDSAALVPTRVSTGALPAEGGDVEVKAPLPAALEIREGKGTPKAVGPETVVRLAPATDAAKVSVVAHPVVVPSKLSARRIALWADTPVIWADGAATSGITLVVLDAAGAPVKDAIVAVRMVGGDGAISSEAHTDVHGIAHLAYTAGKTPGPVGIRFDVGSVWSELPLFQSAPGSAGPSLALPLDPVAAAWREATSWTTVWREGKAPPAPPAVGAPFVPPTTTAVAAPVPGAAPVPRPARADGDELTPWVAVGLTDSHGGYSLEGGGTDGIVTEAKGSTPIIGFVGVQGQLDWPVASSRDGTLGPVAMVHLRAEPQDAAGAKAISVQHDLMAGVRWHTAASPGGASGIVDLGIHSLTAVGFEYEDTEPGLFTAGRVGIRPAVGGTVPLDGLTFAALAGCTFAPLPVAGSAELAAEIGEDAIRPRIALGFDYRGFEVENATIQQIRGVLGVGVAWSD
jgi:hypothetical protein